MTDSDKLALGLDDIIRTDRSTNRRGTGRGGRRGFSGRTGGQNNGFRTRGGGGLPRTSNTPVGRWKHDLYNDNSNQVRGGQQRTGGVSSTTKLLISNLDYGVTTNDVEELFGDVGAVRVARVHYDESGRSLGTAEIIFERRVDAVAAQQKYNGLNLDGRPMDIRVVSGVNDGSQQTNRGSYTNGTGGGNQRSGFRNNNQQNGFRGRGNNRSRGGGGGGGRQQNGTGGNAKKGNVTAEDLDADLDAYRAESAPTKS